MGRIYSLKRLRKKQGLKNKITNYSAAFFILLHQFKPPYFTIKRLLKIFEHLNYSKKDGRQHRRQKDRYESTC